MIPDCIIYYGVIEILIKLVSAIDQQIFDLCQLKSLMLSMINSFHINFVKNQLKDHSIPQPPQYISFTKDTRICMMALLLPWQDQG